ncbi:MAG: HAD hydrolase-like protein [Gemmatimonadales bacterium]|nr:HAD hydrolase-like protein [Gemmatimonadales bacterium]
MSVSGRKLVLFDVDGTLLLTAGAGRRAIVAALGAEVDDPRAFEGIRFDGKTDPQIVSELLEAAGQVEPRESERVRRLCHRYLGLLAIELDRSTTGTTLMPGVEPLLDRLEARPGVVLGLLTGNLAEGAALKLRSARINPSRFRLGAYGSDAGHRAALPGIAARRAEPFFGRIPRGSEVVIIGDTPADIQCGEAISARAVGVATGSYSSSDLAACGPHAVFEDLSDTERVMEAILR